MAGITVTKAEWDALLQEDYVLDGIVSSVNKATPFKTYLKRKGMTAGRRRIYPVQTDMSQGNGARAEGADTPDYGAEEFVDAIVQAKYNYGTFKVTGPAMEFSTRKAWVEFADRQLQGTKEGLTQNVGRQCWGDGSGKLALINNGAGYAAAATTVTVDSAYGVLWGSVATKTTFLLRKNMLIQFDTEDNGGNGYKITSLTATTVTFTPGLAGAIVDNAPIYMLGSKLNEITGFLKFVATAAFQTGVLNLADSIYNGIDRSLHDSWEGNVVNAAAALSLTLVRSLKDVVYARAEDEDSNLCINSLQITRDFEALLTPSQRFVPPMKLTGGYTALDHDGLRLTKDSKAPVGAFNILNTDYIAWAQTQDPHWDNDGSGILHRIEGQDARFGMLKWYAELDVDEPRRNGILYNITTS